MQKVKPRILIVIVTVLCLTLLIGSFILTILCLVPNTYYPKILLPESGSWFCEELTCTLNFTTGTASIVYENVEYRNCAISGEHHTNYVYVITQPEYAVLLSGLCTERRGNRMTIDVDGTEYIFVQE